MVVLAIVGPTATGKSELGIEIAQRLGGQVINADAMQFYRGMDIGTAKVPLEQRRGIPHHQLDVLAVTDEASVAGYQSDACAEVDRIQGEGQTPILVGGSGLYLRAVLDGMDFPGTDSEIRAKLQDEAAVVGPGAMHSRLAGLDPAAARSIGPANTRRIVRALEVIELTGRPFSATLPAYRYARPTVQIGLRDDLGALDTRIAARVHDMIGAGLVEEVATLAQQGLRDGKTASRAVGYSQILAHLDGQISLSDAQEQIALATRRLARKQIKWFRRDPRINWLDVGASNLLDQALAAIRKATS